MQKHQLKYDFKPIFETLESLKSESENPAKTISEISKQVQGFEKTLSEYATKTEFLKYQVENYTSKPGPQHYLNINEVQPMPSQAAES